VGILLARCARVGTDTVSSRARGTGVTDDVDDPWDCCAGFTSRGSLGSRARSVTRGSHRNGYETDEFVLCLFSRMYTG